MDKHPACIATKYGWVELDHQKQLAINCVTQELHNKILQSPFYKDREGIYWPKVSKIPGSEISPSNEVIGRYQTEYIYHILRYPEFTPRQFTESLHFLLEVCKYCKANGYYLRSHLWNVTYRNGRPFLIDIRDFETLNGQDWVTIFKGHFRSNLDLHCPVPASNFIVNHDEISNKLNRCPNSLEEIEKVINQIKVKPVGSGKWTDYHNHRTDFLEQYDRLTDELFDRIKNYGGGSKDPTKSINLIAEVERIKPATIIEVGCNNGLYCFGVSRFTNSVVGIDTDIVSIDRANILNGRLNTPCTFMCGNVVDLVSSPSYGKNGAYGNAQNRVKSEMLIAPAVMHHLFKAYKSLDLIISRFGSLATKYMIIEHIPNVYDEGELVRLLGMYKWKIVKEVPSSPAPREYFVCEKE